MSRIIDNDKLIELSKELLAKLGFDCQSLAEEDIDDMEIDGRLSYCVGKDGLDYLWYLDSDGAEGLIRVNTEGILIKRNGINRTQQQLVVENNKLKEALEEIIKKASSDPDPEDDIEMTCYKNDKIGLMAYHIGCIRKTAEIALNGKEGWCDIC